MGKNKSSIKQIDTYNNVKVSKNGDCPISAEERVGKNASKKAEKERNTSPD